MSANFCPLMRFVFMLFDSVFLFILGVIAADDLSKPKPRSFVKAFFHLFSQKARKAHGCLIPVWWKFAVTSKITAVTRKVTGRLELPLAKVCGFDIVRSLALPERD